MSDSDLIRPSVTDALPLAAVLAHVAASALIDGLAFYGPPDTPPPGGDYDLLALVHERPHGLSQLFTSVDGCTTDVLFLDVATFDAVLAGHKLTTGTADAVFLQKLGRAGIIVDRSQRLARWRETTRDARDLFRTPGYPGRYAVWFSQNFALAHLKRLARSDDPVYRTTVRLLLGAAVSRTCRAYFDLRQQPWEGEKRAVQHFATHDPAYAALLRQCLDTAEIAGALATYDALVARTLEPFGPVWPRDVLAASFVSPVTDATMVQSALDHWTGLFS
jgi:hypothetical protein